MFSDVRSATPQESLSQWWAAKIEFGIKLDGVGPVDNRPSNNKLHRFVKKRKKKSDRWHFVGVDHSLKIWAP